MELHWAGLEDLGSNDAIIWCCSFGKGSWYLSITHPAKKTSPNLNIRYHLGGPEQFLIFWEKNAILESKCLCFVFKDQAMKTSVAINQPIQYMCLPVFTIQINHLNMWVNIQIVVPWSPIVGFPPNGPADRGVGCQHEHWDATLRRDGLETRKRWWGNLKKKTNNFERKNLEKS